MSDSDEFDHYLSDNDIDFESLDTAERSINSIPNPKQQQPPPPPPRTIVPSRASVVPPQARPPVSRPVQPAPRAAGSNARPSASFLRPPKPPPRLNRPPTQAVVTSPQKQQQPVAAEEQAPAPKRRRVSLNEKGQEGFVDPNPFNNKSTRVNAIKQEEGAGGAGILITAKGTASADSEEEPYVEENMPELRMREGENGEILGYEMEARRGITVLPKEMNARVETNGARAVESPKVGAQRLVRRVNNNQNGFNSTAGGQAGEEAERSRSHSVSRQISEGSVRRESHPAQAGGIGGRGGMSDADLRELEELRKEKARLKAALEVSERERHKAEEQVLTKAGETQLVRSRMNKAEQAHQIAIKEQESERAKIAASLQAKEQELHNERERMKTKEAFAQIEQNQSMHSSARKSAHRPQAPGSSQRSINRAPRGASVPAGASRMRDGESPSTGRSRSERASSARPSQQQSQVQAPAFPNFHNSFAESPRGPALTRRSPKRNSAASTRDQSETGGEQEGSMAPPPFPMTGGKNLKSALKTAGKEKVVDGKKGKGKERAVPEEDESFFSEGHGGEVSFDTIITEMGGQNRSVRQTEDDEEREAREEGPEWDWVEEERDWRGEILSAVFSHTTFNSIDPSSVLPITGPLLTQPRATAFSGSTAVQSRSHAYSVSTFTARTMFQPTSTRSSTSMSRQNSHNSSTSYAVELPPDPPSSTGPFPTFHSLMNLRFPQHSSPDHVTSYVTATRNLFTLLGRRMDPRIPLLSQTSLPYPSTADLDSPYSALHLCSNLSHSFQILLTILDEAGLVGPITALLSLINHLIYLFPPFARSILDNSKSVDDEVATSDRGGMLQIIATMISRYGKVPSASSLAASQASNGIDKRKYQNQRSRQAARNTATRIKKKGEGEVERVIIEDAEKRESLLKELTAVAEGLAWRYTSETASNRNAENQFIALLSTPQTMSTMLDPSQPVSILLSSSRTLALLAPRSIFYREILSIKIADSSDVRKSPLPIFDRIATLLNLQSDSPLLFDLHSALVVLSSSLLTHQPDSLRLVFESPRFIADGLIKRIHRDVETVWEWDGKSVGVNSEIRNSLRRTTQRLFSCVTLLYYLLFAPHSSLSLNAVFQNSQNFSKDAKSSSIAQLSYVQDWCSVALGTLAFTEGLPSWAEPEEEGLHAEAVEDQALQREGNEGARLMDMKYLAQEIMEDLLPAELDDIVVCFGVLEDDEEEDENDDEQEGDEEENRMED